MLVPFPELISDHFTDGETEGPAGLNNLPKVLQLVKTWRHDSTQEFSLQVAHTLHNYIITERLRRLSDEETDTGINNLPWRPARGGILTGASLSAVAGSSPCTGMLNNSQE